MNRRKFLSTVLYLVPCVGFLPALSKDIISTNYPFPRKYRVTEKYGVWYTDPKAIRGDTIWMYPDGTITKNGRKYGSLNEAVSG